MKINVTQVLNNFDGKPMKENRQEGEDDAGKPVMKLVDLTLRSVLCTALMHTTQAEAAAGPSAEQRVRRFMIAQVVVENDVVVLRSEDITYLKERVNNLFPTNVVAVTYRMLEPSSWPKRSEVVGVAKKAPLPAPANA